MQIVIGILVFAGVGAIALADPPSPAPTQSATSTSTLSPPAPATPPAPAAPPAAPAASPPHETTAATDLREKMLRSKGYHLEMRPGEKVYCRVEPVMGSRLGGNKSCGTVEELAAREYRSQELIESAQRNQLNKTGK